MTTRLVTATLLLFGLAAASAGAANTLPVTMVGPANGSTVPVRDTLMSFEFASPVDLDSAHIVVATQATVEPDGGLARADQVDYFRIDESDLDPHVYRDVASYLWTQDPGRYYWQIQASHTEQPSDDELESEPAVYNYLSPVYQLVIASSATPVLPPTSGPSPSPTLTVSEANASVRTLIKSKSGGAPHYLNAKCVSQSTSRATCKTSWTSSTHRTAARTWLYDGVFSFEARVGAVSFSFLGRRGRYGCVRRFSMKHCASRVHWR